LGPIWGLFHQVPPREAAALEGSHVPTGRGGGAAPKKVVVDDTEPPRKTVHKKKKPAA
jgi:hypothetical protein